MDRQLWELRTVPSEYPESCHTILTPRRQPVKQIVSEGKTVDPEGVNAFDELMQCINEAQSLPDSKVYDPEKEERLTKKALLP